MPFTGAKRLRKTCGSGNREMETALCKLQNFSLKSRQNFSDFHNKLFFGLGSSRNGSGKREKRRFCILCTKAAKSRPKTLEGNPQLFCGILLPGRTPFSYFFGISPLAHMGRKVAERLSRIPASLKRMTFAPALRNGRKSSEFR